MGLDLKKSLILALFVALFAITSCGKRDQDDNQLQQAEQKSEQNQNN